ncbi:hypothetical protein ABK040_011137 [Willaertia magna]
MSFTDLSSDDIYTILSFLSCPFKIKAMCSVDLLSKSFSNKLKESLDLTIWKEMFELKFLQKEEKLKNLYFKESINYKYYFSVLNHYLSLYYLFLQSQPKTNTYIKPNYDEKPQQEEMAMVGASKVGKTCFLKYFTYPSHNYKTSIVCDIFAKQITIDNTNILLSIWEIGLTLNYYFSFFRKTMMKRVEAFVFICDITKKETLYMLEEYLETIIKVKYFSSNFSCIFCFNKIDLPREITDEEIDHFIKEMIDKGYVNKNCKLLKTSVKQYVNISETFYELVMENRIRRKCYGDSNLTYELMEKLYLNGKEDLLREINDKLQPDKYYCLNM